MRRAAPAWPCPWRPSPGPKTSQNHLPIVAGQVDARVGRPGQEAAVLTERRSVGRIAALARPTEVTSTVTGMMAYPTAPRSKDMAGAAPRGGNHHPPTGHVGHDIPNLSHRTTVR